MTKTDIVSVIELDCGTVERVHNFYDNHDGNEKAKEEFRDIIMRDNDGEYNEENIAIHIDDGYYNSKDSGCTVYLWHGELE